MKRMLLGILVASGLASMLHANCGDAPAGMELAKSIEAKEIEKAKQLLEEYKAEVKKYLEGCNNDKDKFEETSVMILTYEDRLADVEADLKKASAPKVDCSKVPSGKAIDAASDAATAKKLYATYKKEAQAYLDGCASHAEYETVFEESLLYDEQYGE